MSPGALLSARRARRTCNQAEADFDVLAFDAESARAFGAVAASLHASGRKPTARAYDALIAANAIAHGLPPYSCDPADF
jgi:tRNA(fMet)-specific endonuclease VapC